MKLINFLFEVGQLKRVKRSGWWTINIKDPETVAEHCQRCAALGYFLAKLEKVDSSKVVLMCLFNDLHETRINDLHKVGHKYIDFREAEDQVQKDQLEELDPELLGILTEFQERETKEAIVARDADLLENALQAKEYLKIGYKDAQIWINNVKKLVKTDSAKKMVEEIESTDPNAWLQGLKKIDY